MASTEFKTEGQAITSYETWDFRPDHDKVKTGVDAYKRTFCKIAAFLCNKSDFEMHLRYASQRIWERYIDIPPATNNRFTRAISLAAEPLGFRIGEARPPAAAHAPPPSASSSLPTTAPPSTASPSTASLSTGAPPTAVRPPLDPHSGEAMRIKLVAADPELGYMLRNKLFWKDSMNNRHGEYSHCLQWLAIGIKFPGEAADAYAVSGYFAARYAPDDSPVYIWQWLADCFPPDLQSNATACSRPNATETICSNSYRTPQIITDYLVRNPRGALKDNFVSHYLVRRYVERGWLRTDPDPSRKKGELRSLHGNAQALAEEKKAAGGFTNSTRAGDTGKARWVRTEDPVPKAVDKIRTVQVEFHGRKGVF